MSCANSAVKLMFDGVVVCTNGRRFTRLVNHWLCVFHAMFNPQMVLFSGSLPMATFEVSGCSPRCMSVPPTCSCLEKSYWKSRPNIVLRCMP